MKIANVPIDSIHADPANVRRHPQRNLDGIKASLARFGQQKPIVVDAAGVVRAGNGTLDAARALGWEQIAVVRTPLAGTEATAYSIADNRTGELAEWDETGLAETLRALQSEDFDLAAVGYNAGEVDELIERLANEARANGTLAEDPGAQVDRAAEFQEKWQTATGQLWVIPSKATPGKEHRLLCGDATDATQVNRVLGDDRPWLMVTDPPYGVALDQSWRDRAKINSRLAQSETAGLRYCGKNIYKSEASGSLFTSTDVKADWSDAFEIVPSLQCAYVWHASAHAWEVEGGLRRIGFEPVQQIIWVKPSLVLGRQHYHWKHEPCFYMRKKKAKIPWYGPNNAVTTWEATSPKAIFGKRAEDKQPHPCQKPLVLMQRPLEYHLKAGGLVYEPFCGSGTTMAAAESCGRICIGVECEPNYTAVALERLAGMGLTPHCAQ